MVFSPLSLHQLTKLPTCLCTLFLVVSLVAVRVVLIADTEMLYPGGNTAQLPCSQPEGLQIGVEGGALVGSFVL